MSDRKITRRPTRGIFKEFGGDILLDDWRKTFVETEDLTEYKGAMALVGDWKEWLRFKREWSSFQNIVDEWKEEIEVRLRSRAVAQLIKASESSVDAAKWVAEGKFNRRKPGTPTKAEKEREIKIQTKMTDAVEDEIARVLDVRDQRPN